MRRLIASLIAASLIAAAITGAASAQVAKKPRHLIVPQPRPAAAPAPAAPVPGVRILRDGSPGIAGLATPPPPVSITPIPPPATAPQCRVQCARDRYFCSTSEDPACDNHWRRCVSACSSASSS